MSITAMPQDLYDQILSVMKKMGVTPLPANYELFYEAVANKNMALMDELKSAGRNPSPQTLRELGFKYFPEREGAGTVHHIRDQIAKQIENVDILLRDQSRSLADLSQSLDLTAEKLGADESMPLGVSVALNLVKTSLVESNQRIQMLLNAAMREQNAFQEMQRRLKEVELITITDQLTGLPNRKAFDDEMVYIFSGHEKMFYCLLVIDVDNFKAFNVSYGHLAGDRVLKSVAVILRKALRKDTFLARISGDKFAVILKNVTTDTVWSICERLRSAVENFPLIDVRTNKSFGTLNISVGFCQAAEAESALKLHEYANRALKASKENGRNKTTDFTTLAAGLSLTTGVYQMYKPAV